MTKNDQAAAPITHLRSKMHRKAGQSNARIKLSADFINGLAEQYDLYGDEILDAVRKENPVKLAEIIARLIPQAPVPTGLFDDANSHEEIARRMLRAIGLDDPTDEQIAEAVAAHEKLVAQLEAIRDRAQTNFVPIPLL